MSTFKQVRAEKPPAFVTVPVSAFKTTWGDRPKSPVVAGLRTLSSADMRTARSTAAKKALEFHPTGLGAAYDEDYNDCLISEALVVAICDPNDARSGAPWLKYAADNVYEAFTPDGARFIYAALCKLTLEQDPTSLPLDDVEAKRLCIMLTGGGLDRLPSDVRGSYLRRLRDLYEDLRTASET